MANYPRPPLEARIRVDTSAFEEALRNVGDAFRAIRASGLWDRLQEAENNVPLEISPDATPWVQGWPVLIDWLDDLSFPARDVCRISAWNDGWTVATFETYVRDDMGNIRLDRDREGRSCAMKEEHAVLLWGEHPPYRTPSGREVVWGG